MSKAVEYERIAFENEKIRGQLEINGNKNKFIQDIKSSYNIEMEKVYITAKKNDSKIKKFLKRLFKVI